MPAAAIDLQKALFEALAGDAAVAAIVGGRIFDHAPPDVAFPYLSFGRASAFDWSTASEAGSEHIVTLHAWSKAKGKREAMALLDAARACLHDAALPLADHHLVALRVEFCEARFEEDVALHHGILRLRAVIEPAA